MMRIELDWVLEYLATGERGELVLQVLDIQEDAAELLAQARATILEAADGKPGRAVRSRLAHAARAVRRNPNASGRSAGPSVQSPVADMPASRSFTIHAAPPASYAEPARVGEFAPANFGPLSGAVEAGAGEFVDLGAVIFDRRHQNPVRLDERIRQIDPPKLLNVPQFLRRSQPEELGDEPEALARAAMLEPPPVDYSMHAKFEQDSFESEDIPLDADAVRLAARDGGGGGVLLWASGEGRSAQVIVQVEELSGPEMAQVLWLSDEGVVTRATTDGAGMARLPWPTPGRGQLRVDAVRTYVVKVRVDK